MEVEDMVQQMNQRKGKKKEEATKISQGTWKYEKKLIVFSNTKPTAIKHKDDHAHLVSLLIFLNKEWRHENAHKYFSRSTHRFRLLKVECSLFTY